MYWVCDRPGQGELHNYGFTTCTLYMYRGGGKKSGLAVSTATNHPPEVLRDTPLIFTHSHLCNYLHNIQCVHVHLHISATVSQVIYLIYSANMEAASLVYD